MTKNVVLYILLIFSLAITGCSMPAAAKQGNIYSFTKVEKKKQSLFAKSYESVKDFREIEMYTEDIDALKEDVEKYIATHPELSDEIKKNLREIKVTLGETKEEVQLLLGDPDKITGQGVWIYRISKWRAFTVFIIPVFFVREGYYLYFKDDVLVDIQRHYLKQMIQQSPGPGVYEQGKGSSSDSEAETE